MFLLTLPPFNISEQLSFQSKMHKVYLINEVLSRVVQGEDQQVEREQHQEVFTGFLWGQMEVSDKHLTPNK